MSIARKLSELDARSGEILAQRDGEKALDLLAANLAPLTNSLRAALDRGALLPVVQREIAEMLGIEPPPDLLRSINQRGLELVKHFEGLYLSAYQDAVGIWTIGWGHTGLQHRDGTVHRGRVITNQKAEELLRYDMNQFEAAVTALVKVPLTDDQFAALVAFAFNVGADIDADSIAEGLGDSTLLRKLNARDYSGAADEFLKWNKAGGKVLRGLTRRRRSERNLFLGETQFIIPA